MNEKFWNSYMNLSNAAQELLESTVHERLPLTYNGLLDTIARECDCLDLLRYTDDENGIYVFPYTDEGEYVEGTAYAVSIEEYAEACVAESCEDLLEEYKKLVPKMSEYTEINAEWLEGYIEYCVESFKKSGYYGRAVNSLAYDIRNNKEKIKLSDYD